MLLKYLDTVHFHDDQVQVDNYFGAASIPYASLLLAMHNVDGDDDDMNIVTSNIRR